MTDRSSARARVHPAGSAVAVEAVAYDFESPELLTNEQRGRLQGAFEVWSRTLSTQLTAKTRVVTTVVAEPFVLATAAAFRARFGRDRLFVVAGVDGEDARLVYSVPASDALRWASRLLGGSGIAPSVAAPPTDIERALIWHLVEEQLAELDLALGGLLPAVAVEGITRSLGTAVAGADDMMLCARFAIEQAGGGAPLDLAVPAAPLLLGLGLGLDPQDPATVRQRLERHVAEAPVPVVLRFDPTRVNSSTVLGLGAGTVLPLEHPAHRPLQVAVDGHPVLRAVAGAHGDRLACVVVEAEGAA